jgi:sigma-B regulation protein RsbU (phosphoserine phosphatase)
MHDKRRIERLLAENGRLRLAVEELSILNEVSSAVSSTSSLDATVDLIVQKCVKHLTVEQGALLLFDKLEGGSALKTMIRKVERDSGEVPLRLGDQITGWMLKHQKPLVVNDFAADSRFRALKERDGIRSLLCVPMKLKGRLIGVLNVFNKKGGVGFSAGDQRLLSIIATQSAQVVENARLMEEEKALELLQEELRLARGIQKNLLPKEPPQVAGYGVAGLSEPAKRVGGDYFDFLDFGEHRLGLCLADVSGKGITAALLMSNVQATIRSQGRLAPDVGACVSRSNDMLHASTDSNKFVTMFYGVLNTQTHLLEYCNAGHNPPIMLAGGNGPALLETGGPVLGVLPGFPYQRGETEFRPGQTLLVYSDGFSEAMNPRFEEFGDDRLRASAESNAALPPGQLVNSLLSEVSAFCGDAPQADDMTIMVVQRLAE